MLLMRAMMLVASSPEGSVDTLTVETAPGVHVWVEIFGDTSQPACLLIAGAGANSDFWSSDLIEALLAKGFCVIRYDHRDFGRSSRVDEASPPYDMMDLTQDAVTVLDACGAAAAHVVGHSMGGFIAQLMAIHYPARVLSICSLSSSTSSPDLPPPPEKTWEIFLAHTPVNDFAKDLPGFLTVWKHLNGTAAFEPDLAVAYTYDLYARQKIEGALGASHVRAQEGMPDRSAQLRALRVPALVVHGEEDSLVDVAGGIRTAECIPGAQLVLIPEMGHLPFNRGIREQWETAIAEFLGSIVPVTAQRRVSRSPLVISRS